MAIPALATVNLVNAVTSGTTATVSRPIRPGRTPFTERTRGKRPAFLRVHRTTLQSTTGYSTFTGFAGSGMGTLANQFPDLAVWGCELPYATADFGVDPATGLSLPGYRPEANAYGTPSQTGGYVQRIKTTALVAANGCAFVEVAAGGSGYAAGDTFTITGASGSTATAGTLIVRNGRVVGAAVTTKGATYGTPTIAITTSTGSGCVLRPYMDTTVGTDAVTILTNIPYAAHAPTTAGGAFWFASVNDKIISCTGTAIMGRGAAGTDDGGIESDQHFAGFSSGTAEAGLTVSNSSGAALITLGGSGSLPKGTIVDVYRGYVRNILSAGVHVSEHTQVKTLDAMWVSVAAAIEATPAVNNHVYLEPAI